MQRQQEKKKITNRLYNHTRNKKYSCPLFQNLLIFTSGGMRAVNVDAFIRRLMDIRAKGVILQLTQDLLAIYLSTLTARIPPLVFNEDKELIQLSEFVAITEEKELSAVAEYFFKSSLVEETISAIKAGRYIPFKLYPCALFLCAITNGAISQNLLHLKTAPNQEEFFKRYLPEEGDRIRFSDHKSQEKTILFGVIPPENKGNTFSSYRPTEKTKRLFDATVNFTQALFSKNKDKNLILILSGTPGIGKTHLVLAAINEARQNGISTYYITYGAFSSASYKEKEQLKEKIQKNPGLLVIDDCNKKAFDDDFTKFVTTLYKTSNTSILITSNESLGNIRSQLPFGDNIVVCEDNIDVTQRH
jgi:DNA replication protein DnaC